MTEQEWLQATDPDLMLEYLRGKASKRKLRLFAVACCRRVWPLLDDKRSRRAVEVVEHYADGLASTQDLKEAHEAAGQACQMPARTAASDASRVDGEVAFHPDDAANHAAWATPGRTRAGERQAQADLLRCIFSPHPFRPIAIDPCWRTWHGGLVVSMSRRMYDARDFSDMPVLADALEEAGCNDADILGHCRSGGEHVRGCWVIDLLLGKE
jgi:hypothetical protein